MKYILFIGLFYFTGFCLRSQNATVTPNPFEKRTLLTYTLVNSDSVSISIVNGLGQQILTPVSNSIMTSGSHQDSIRMDSYPSGIYFLSLKLKKGPSKVMKLIKTGTVGLEEIGQISEINIFPNPVNDKLIIDFKTDETKTIRLTICNSLGQTVHTSDNITRSQEIDIVFLTDGVYHLILQDNSERRVFKLVKK